MTYFLRNKALENFSQMFTLTGESFEYAGTLWGINVPELIGLTRVWTKAVSQNLAQNASVMRVKQTRQV